MKYSVLAVTALVAMGCVLGSSSRTLAADSDVDFYCYDTKDGELVCKEIGDMIWECDTYDPDNKSDECKDVNGSKRQRANPGLSASGAISSGKKQGRKKVRVAPVRSKLKAKKKPRRLKRFQRASKRKVFNAKKPRRVGKRVRNGVKKLNLGKAVRRSGKRVVRKRPPLVRKASPQRTVKRAGRRRMLKR